MNETIDIEVTREKARRALASLGRKFEMYGHTWDERSKRMHAEARATVEGGDRQALEIWTAAFHLPEDTVELSPDTIEYLKQHKPQMEKELGFTFERPDDNEPFDFPDFFSRLIHKMPKEGKE